MQASPSGPVWYGLPGRTGFSWADLERGLAEVGDSKVQRVIWLQHEFGIWSDQAALLALLKRITLPKLVTFHTLHFQSDETRFGLRRREYDLLKEVLPVVEGITVFSLGAYRAVSRAFPSLREKVHVLEHGVHRYPQVARLTRGEARQQLLDFLLHDSDLCPEAKEALHRDRVFSDPDALLLGQTGFLCTLKRAELLYHVASQVQRTLPFRRILGVRIGAPRETEQETYAQGLRHRLSDPRHLLMETWLPEPMLPIAQRAFDVNFYWPDDCTQSGILSHALGAGAIIAGRDLEGSGEVLERAGAVRSRHLSDLVSQLVGLLLSPGRRKNVEERALAYATRYSWENQARWHRAAAEGAAFSKTLRVSDSMISGLALDLTSGDEGSQLAGAGSAP